MQLVDGQIVIYRGYGRSLYVCLQCVDDEKRVNGLARRFKLDREELFVTLKEFRDNG